jgi:hypothetical protein
MIPPEDKSMLSVLVLVLGVLDFDVTFASLFPFARSKHFVPHTS